MPKKFNAWLLDADYVAIEGKPGIRLLLKDVKTNHTFRLYDSRLEPYFYLLPTDKPDVARQQAQKLTAPFRSEIARVKRVEVVKRHHDGKEKTFLQIYTHQPGHVPKLREAAKALGHPFEYDIPFYRRYLIDTGLIPFSLVVGQAEGHNVQDITSVATQESPGLRLLAFDIETYNPRGMPSARHDPVLMISYADGKENKVLSHTRKFTSSFVHAYPSEPKMIEAFCQLLRDKHVDLLSGYNSDQFDLVYLAERAKTLKINFWPGRVHQSIKTHGRGIRNATRVPGRVHFDVYNTMRFLEIIGAIRPPRLTLDHVYQEILGKTKPAIAKLDIHKLWDGTSKDLTQLAEYNQADAQACLELAQYALPLEVELSRVSGLTLFDASRSTTGQLVEALFLRQAHQQDIVARNRPHLEKSEDGEAEGPIQGALVKTPEPGVYENLAVVDFKSMYPSIIISHNVDPVSLDAQCCGGKDVHVSPQGQRFCKKHEGLVPVVLRKVLAARAAIRTEMKKHKPESTEYQQLYARQWALKIVMNSAYGYLLYPRSRWYSRPAGEAVTAWSRHYIQQIAQKAESAGLKVLYYDTDGAILQFDQPQDAPKVKHFVAQMNEELPEAMELELEDYYPRGVFVSKRQEQTGAKKKYALISKEGRIKIRGFELVRRDWSKVARDTQREVLDILLREGNVPKALATVRRVVEQLRSGQTPLSDCVIYTQLRKKSKAYEVVSPELAAFQKARAAGLPLQEGSVVSYVITRAGKTTSEKAQVLELAKDYDPDYYINKQVLPGVLKLLGTLGVSEQDLITHSKQKGLEEF